MVKVVLPLPTVRSIVADEVSVPEVQVTVITVVASVAEEGTVNVRTLVVAVGLVANAVVIPVGRPDAAQVTLPVNPFTSVTVMVLVPVLPGATVSAAGEAAMV